MDLDCTYATQPQLDVREKFMNLQDETCTDEQISKLGKTVDTPGFKHKMVKNESALTELTNTGKYSPKGAKAKEYDQIYLEKKQKYISSLY